MTSPDSRRNAAPGARLTPYALSATPTTFRSRGLCRSWLRGCGQPPKPSRIHLTARQAGDVRGGGRAPNPPGLLARAQPESGHEEHRRLECLGGLGPLPHPMRPVSKPRIKPFRTPAASGCDRSPNPQKPFRFRRPAQLNSPANPRAAILRPSLSEHLRSPSTSPHVAPAPAAATTSGPHRRRRPRTAASRERSSNCARPSTP